MAEEIKQFGIADLLIFIGTLGVSVVVGVYYAIKDRKAKHVDHYYFGGKNMSPVAVGLSISVTFVSAITIIGFPAETYFYGTVMFWFGWFNIVPYIFACLFYIPLVHKLKVASIYEYLELRYNKFLRKSASLIAVITMIIYMGMTVYVPGLALQAVTPLGLSWTIVLTSMICTFYTTLGGIKAVIWTDVVQTVTMTAGALAPLIKTAILVGGFGEIWPAAKRGGRLNTWSLNLDPTIRYTMWTFLLGHGIGSCRMTCINQSICQRYLSCGSINKARIAALISTIPTFLLTTVAVLTGTAMYTYYEGCDPLSRGEISKQDEMMPYMVLDIFQNYPGMTGLFVAAGFSGTLSTVSSGINSLGVLIMEDFVLHIKPNISQMARLTISKAIVFGFGFLVMCVSFTISQFDASILRIGFSLGSALEGPLLGVFTLGIFFPWSTSLGAIIGQLVGTMFSCWITIGSLLFGMAANPKLPVSVDQCPTQTTTSLLAIGTHFSTKFLPLYGKNATSTSSYDETTVFTSRHVDFLGSANEVETATTGSSIETTLYAISFLYIPVFSMAVTVIVGLAASFITGANKPSEADPRLFVPFIDNRELPKKVRKFFRFGVPHPCDEKSRDDKQDDSMEEYKLVPGIDEKESVL